MKLLSHFSDAGIDSAEIRKGSADGVARPFSVARSALFLFLGDAHGDAAVLSAACVGAVVGHGMIFAVTFGVHARGIDAKNDELLHHVVGAILGEFQVCRGGGID